MNHLPQGLHILYTVLRLAGFVNGIFLILTNVLYSTIFTNPVTSSTELYMLSLLMIVYGLLLMIPYSFVRDIRVFRVFFILLIFCTIFVYVRVLTLHLSSRIRLQSFPIFTLQTIIMGGNLLTAHLFYTLNFEKKRIKS